MGDSNKEQNYFVVDEQYKEWCKEGPCFNEIIFQNLHVPLF